MFTAASLIRPEIAELEPYTPILPLDVLAARLGLPAERLVKLDANENPYGPSPKALDALAHEPFYHIYPDPAHTRLRAATDGAKILFLTSPNNPTGNLTPPEQIARLLRLPLLVVVDEAYLEFAGGQGVGPWVGRHDNLAVLRTFSKWAGLAGLRVGYGLLPAWLAEQLWKIKQPYNVSVAGQEAAIASLADREVLLANVALIVSERERLLPLLAELPFLRPMPSAANFILCRVEGRSARELKLALERQGILVRYYSTPLLRDYIRISVGTPEQSAVLLAALA